LEGGGGEKGNAPYTFFVLLVSDLTIPPGSEQDPLPRYGAVRAEDH